MPKRIFKSEEEKEKHYAKCRECNKRKYHADNGRLKGQLKYYKYKYIDNEYVINIVNDREMQLIDKINTIKMYNFEQRLIKKT